MKHATLCTLYCEQAEVLREQLANWRTWPDAVWDLLDVVVVDDCSESQAAADVLAGCGLPVRLLRLDRPVPWNLAAGRNLAVGEARTGLVLVADLDQVLPTSGAVALGAAELEAGTYALPVRFLASGESLDWRHQHLQLIRRADFLELGGYDEAWPGYEGDNLWVPRRDSKLRAVEPPEGLTLVQLVGAGSTKWSKGGRFNARFRGGRAYSNARVVMAKPAGFCLTPWHEVQL
jgi:Glycosyl transferase family 2